MPDQHIFVEMDVSALEASLVAMFSEVAGYSPQPGNPERLFLHVLANTLLMAYAKLNYTGNQNLLRFSEGEHLDELVKMFFVRERLPAQAAQCTMKFTISQAQPRSIIIQAGTRCTDQNRSLYWETIGPVEIKAGETEATGTAVCQTPGTAGNGWEPGQISTLVDIYDFYDACENTTRSDGGSDTQTDEELRESARLSMDGYSTAGPYGGYVYRTKQVSTEISDVKPYTPEPGTVAIVAITKDGKPASEELKQRILDANNADTARPMTDKVIMEDPEEVEYNINATYYLSYNGPSNVSVLEAAVKAAAEEFQRWQCEEMGRDINPSKLHQLLMETGIKRVVITEPEFRVLRNGQKIGPVEKDAGVPQLAKIGTVTLTNGGFEDD